MLDWTPYLSEILGKDPAKDNYEQMSGEDLLTIATALVDRRPQVDDRVRLLRWIADLDDVQQVFLLPELGRQLADPSVIVRNRLLSLLSDIGGDESAVKDTLTNLGALLDAPAPAERQLHEILQGFEQILLNESGLDLAMPLAALQFLRRPVFALALLAGLGHSLASTSVRQPLLAAMERYFEDEQRAPLRDQLQKWLTHGPLFLRYLVVRFVDETGLSPSDRKASLVLLDAYRSDPDPLVASAAIEAYAHHVEPAELSVALALLRGEFTAFARRPLNFQREFNDAGFESPIAIRMLSLGVLRALGNLALIHLPDPRPLEELRRILFFPLPQGQLLLDLSDAEMPPELRENVFHAAVLLQAPHVWVRVMVSGRNRIRLQAEVGVGQPVRISDPDRLLAQHPAAAFFWAEPQPAHSHPNMPRRWTYRIRSVVGEKDRRMSTDLVGIMSPVLSSFTGSTPTRWSDPLMTRTEEEIDTRGWWMRAACEVVAAIVEKGITLGMPVSEEPMRPMFAYLVNMGLGTALARYPQRSDAEMIRARLKDTVRSLFLNVLARREVFDALFTEEEVGPLEAQLLVQLAQASLRSLPGTTARYWIDHNIDVLLSVIGTTSHHVRNRAAAALALAYGSLHVPRVRKALESFVLPLKDVYEQVPGALRFTTDEALISFYRRNASSAVAFRFAAGEDLEKENRLVFVFTEMLARALASGEHDSDRADQAAAAILGAQASLQALARLRLVQAFAEYAAPLTKNGLRLLLQLLRTSSGAELALYFGRRAEVTDAPLSREIFSLLVSILSDDNVGNRSAGRRFDRTEVADRLARRRIVVALLTGYALAQGTDFFQRYSDFRAAQPHGFEMETVIAAQGPVLRTDGRNEDSSGLWTVLQPATGDGTPLAGEAGDIVAAFVYHPEPGTELSCLAHFHPMPAGALDLHTRHVEAKAKQELLQRQLATGKALLLARVVSEGTDQKYIVDLGVGTAELDPRQIVVSPRPLRVEDAVLVEVTRFSGPQLFLTDGKFKPRDPLPGIAIEDLRNAASALDSLSRRDEQRPRRRYFLRATVWKVRPQKVGDARCELDLGFRQLMPRGDCLRPVAYFPSSTAPAAGDEILVEPQDLRFEKRNSLQFSFRTLVRRPLDQTVLRGTIRWDRRVPGAPRRWYGRIGLLDLPVPRRRLTGDLGTLYALDALPDNHPILERLGTEPLSLRVIDSGEHFSVIDAPPQWRAHDLTLAVASGVVEVVTFLGLDQKMNAMVFEVHNKPDSAHGARRLSRSPLGTLVALFEGELFDSKGGPVQSETLSGGVRLSIGVTLKPVRRDGTPSLPGEGTHRAYASPHLRIIDEPDDTNIEFAASYERERPLRVRVVAIHPELTLALADDVPLGYPTPRLTYEKDRDFPIEVGAEVDAIVSEAEHPASDDFVVKVIAPRTIQVVLNSRRLPNEIRTLFDMDAGALLRGRKRLQTDGACRVRNLRVEPDPLRKFVLPRILDPKTLESAVESIPVLITDVEHRRRRIATPSANIPFLDKHEQVVGVVVGIPHREGLRRVDVRWLDGEPWYGAPDPDISDAWQFDPGSDWYANGDLIRARRGGEGTIVWHEQRRLYGTLIHQMMPYATWVATHARAATTILGTFIRGKVKGDDHYLVVLEPAFMVAVPEHAFISDTRLEDVWPLDRLELELTSISSGVDQNTMLAVHGVTSGPFHEAVGKRCTLEVRGRDNQSGTYNCRFAARTVHGDIELSVVVPGAALSQSQRKVVAKARPTSKTPVALDCTFSGYVLNVARVPRDDKEDSFRLDFEPQFADEAASVSTQKRSLVAALESGQGRVDDAVGRVVQLGTHKDGELILGVELESHHHPDPLPLPEEEQTWISQTGYYATPGWNGKFTVVRDSDGAPLASLRRRRPMSLDRWIEHARISYGGGVIDGHRLLYFGVLYDTQRLACGIPASDGDDFEADSELANSTRHDGPLVLFEVAPGLAFVATQEQLRFFGERFDLQALQHGDSVERFRLFNIGDGSERGIDLQQVAPNVRYEIESFANKRGVFFGSIRLTSKNEAEIFDLCGLAYSPRPLSDQRRGRWKLRLESFGDEQRRWLNALVDDESLYLKFSRADVLTGELYFRVLSTEEVFAKANLVYVRAEKLTPYGSRGRKLEVRPLNRLGDRSWLYFIPDTLYSERLGWLNATSRWQSGVFLACVHDNKAPDIRLSLKHNPFRRFGLLLHGRGGQAIVKGPQTKASVALLDGAPRNDDPFILVELSEGVNVEIPRHRIDWLSPEQQDVQPGDVIFFTPQAEQSRITITDVRRSHLVYLQGDAPATMLTTLWGAPTSRQSLLARAGPNARLQCSLVGLPQLKGDCHPTAEHVECTTLLPQLVTKPVVGEWVHMKDESDVSVVAGLLAVNQQMQVELQRESGERFSVPWNAVTFREAPFGDLALHLKQLTFRNLAAVEASDLPDTLVATPVLAKFDALHRPSLTAMSRWPYPVEHLVEQFPPRRVLRSNTTSHVQAFTVARVDEKRVILEIAPSRFAELPFSLVMPMHHTSLRAGLRIDLASLRLGDTLTLELIVADASTEEFVPRFRVHGVSFGQSRHFESAFSIPMHRDGDGTPFVGIKGGPLFATPALDDHVIDLRLVGRPSDRYLTLRDLFARYGERLMLVGAADQSIQTKRGVRSLIEIGIRVPIKLGGRSDSQPSWLLEAGEAIPTPGALCRVRVLEARFDGASLTAFTYDAGRPRTIASRFLNGRPDERWQVNELPRIGDAVLIHRAADGEYRVAGIPSWAVAWAHDDADVLRLHDLEQRGIVLSQLLRLPNDFMWSTVEVIDRERRVIELSRRVQITRSLPEPGRVVQAHVIGALGKSRLLVDLSGLPWTLGLDELSYGTPNLRELCGRTTHEGGLRGSSIEVVRRPNGRLSALAVYDDLPTHGELEATILNCTPSGVLVIAQGRRIFIPKSELAWCDLDAEQIPKLFQPGERMLVLVSRNEVQLFSHVRTHAIRTEFASLLRNASEPVYVRRVLVDPAKSRAIVRGRSKVLMELALHSEQVIEDRVCAYVRRIDSRRRRVELSLDETPVRLWNLPQTMTAEHDAAAFAVDIFSDEVVKASLEDLQRALSSGGAATVTDWAARQRCLEPSPRNLRLAIEHLYGSFGNSIAWAAPDEQVETGVVASAKRTAFHEIWSQLTDVLTARVAATDVSPIARFAAGYFCLLSGRVRDAEWHLGAAWDDRNLRHHFDVGLSRARAVFLAPKGDRKAATLLLRSLAAKFFAGALRTLIPPLFEPETLESVESDHATFSAALSSGDVDALERLLIRTGARNPNGARNRSNIVWFLLAKARFGPELDRAADAFFDALREEISIGLPVDDRLHVMASLLSFARGDNVEGWWYLNRVKQPTGPDLQVASFWRAWLSDETWAPDTLNASALDRLLVALWRVWLECGWREEADDRSFNALWDAFQRVPVRWVLDNAVCHAVPEPPASRDELVRWATDHGAEAALRPLFAERGLEELMDEPN